MKVRGELAGNPIEDTELNEIILSGKTRLDQWYSTVYKKNEQ